MKLLEKKITDLLAEGIRPDLEDFLSRRIEPLIVASIADDFAESFRDKGVTVVLTAEPAGIAIAYETAARLGCPAIFARKRQGSDGYAAPVNSKTNTTLHLPKRFLKKNDRVLIVDDCIGMGGIALALIELVRQAGAELVGVGVALERAYLGAGKKLSKGEFRSLVFLLASIVLWFFGYNAVTSKYTVYAQNVLDKDATTTLLLANVAAIISYLPVGMVASKLGRKKTILAGVAMLFTAFLGGCFMTASSPSWMLTAMFILAGVAWATINVNSFPMVVEMCSGADVGKYTGYYYTASMAAQSLTPTISGIFMDRIAMTSLFPYAAIFVGLAFFTMLMVKHGDSKVTAKKGLEALDIDD